MSEKDISNSELLNSVKVDGYNDDEVFESLSDKKEKKAMQHSLLINRRCYTKSSFELASNFTHKPSTCKEYFYKCFNTCCPKNLNIWKQKILSVFPFIAILKSYTKNDFFCDIISGLTVGVMHIPQGMAYGILANIDPVYGLYTSFFPVFLYFLFGTSRHISIGVFAVVSLMIGTVVDKADCNFFSSEEHLLNVSSSPPTSLSKSAFINYSSTNPTHFVVMFGNGTNTTMDVEKHDLVEECKLQHALALTFIVGIFQLLMGLFHFGFVTVYLSDPLTRGLTTGAGVHVFTSQIKHVFGISTGRFSGPFKLVFVYKTFFGNILLTNVAPLITSLICIIIIYGLQKWVSPKLKRFIKVPLPAELIVLIFGTLISHYCNFSSPDGFNMKVVGRIPQGIPTPKPPNLFLIPQIVLDAVAVAIVSFTINISMAKMFSTKHGYNLDSNQELIAYGISNMVCCNLNSYVSTASLSRSLVQETTGGKTQVAGLISSCLLLIVLLFVGPLFHDLPNCILAAVIIVNLRGIFLQVLDLKYLRMISIADMLTWIVTCVGVVLTDVDLGLFIGLAFSFLTVVLRHQSPKLHCLGNIPGTELYEDVALYHKAKQLNSIKIFTFGTSLFYANAEYFQSTIEEHLKQCITTTTNNNNNNKPTNDHKSHDLTRVSPPKKKCCFRRRHGGKEEDNNNHPKLPIEKQSTVDQITSDNGHDDDHDDHDDDHNRHDDDDHNDHDDDHDGHDNDDHDDHDDDDHNDHDDEAQVSNLCDNTTHNLLADDESVICFKDGGGDNDGDGMVSTVDDGVKDVIIDCGRMTFVDTVGIQTLDQIALELSKKNMSLSLSKCSDHVNMTLRRAMEMKKLMKLSIFLTTHDAVIFIINSKNKQVPMHPLLMSP